MFLQLYRARCREPYFTQILNVVIIPPQESPIILRDGNGTIYPMAKDCMGGIRDPDWLDLPPINSLGMGVHSLANLPSNSTIKKKAAIIIMAVEVNMALYFTM